MGSPLAAIEAIQCPPPQHANATKEYGEPIFLGVGAFLETTSDECVPVVMLINLPLRSFQQYQRSADSPELTPLSSRLIHSKVSIALRLKTPRGPAEPRGRTNRVDEWLTSAERPTSIFLPGG
jgi:hypothetical protein